MKRVSRVVALFVFAACAASSFAADANGTWVGQFTFGMNPTVHDFHLVLRSGGPVLVGTMIFCKGDCSAEVGRAPIKNGKIDGDTISFGIDTDAKDVPHIDFQGTVTGDSVQFVLSGKPADCPESSCKIGEGSATRKQ